jgi:predicted transcriptional regulator
MLAPDTYPHAVPVQNCMTTNIVACRPDDDVQQAADLMQANQVRRIPVIDQKGILQGMISTADICQRANLPSETTHRLLQKVTVLFLEGMRADFTE